MSYSSTQDFLALLRQTSGGVRLERMPGLDYVLSAMARAGLFTLYVNPTSPPNTNVSSTVWLKTSTMSWVTESAVFLYNPTTQEFEPATPLLWRAVFAAASISNVFQLVTNSAPVNALTTLAAIERDNPAVTSLSLPTVVGRTQPLQIVDWSTNVVSHQINLDPVVGETIMRQIDWSLYSTPDQLNGITLYPSADLLGWVIAP